MLPVSQRPLQEQCRTVKEIQHYLRTFHRPVDKDQHTGAKTHNLAELIRKSNWS
jgi:hypothetical protein